MFVSLTIRARVAPPAAASPSNTISVNSAPIVVNGAAITLG
jgi:hypothetical protein